MAANLPEMRVGECIGKLESVAQDPIKGRVGEHDDACQGEDRHGDCETNHIQEQSEGSVMDDVVGDGADIPDLVLDPPRGSFHNKRLPIDVVVFHYAVSVSQLDITGQCARICTKGVAVV